MLYYYTVDVPTYTVPDMITSVTRNTDFRLCCTRHAQQNQGFCLVLEALVRIRNTTFSLQTAWTGMNSPYNYITANPTLSGENSVLRVRECAVHYAIKTSLVKLKSKEKRNLLLYFVGTEHIHIFCVS